MSVLLLTNLFLVLNFASLMTNHLKPLNHNSQKWKFNSIPMLRVFKNRVLRRIFGPRRDEVTGEWRRLHNEELSDLYSSPNIVRLIKSRRIRWAGHVARMGEERVCIGCWWGNRRERDQWGGLGVDGWIILGWISRRWDVGMWTGLGWPRIGTGGGRSWVR